MMQSFEFVVSSPTYRFPQTEVQRCIIHQIRISLRYVSWKKRKAFVKDLKTVYQSANSEAAKAWLQDFSQG